MNDLEPLIFEAIAHTAGIDVGALSVTSTVKQLGIGSLDAIEMLFDLEEKFGVQLGDHDVDLGTATVSDLIIAIKQAVAHKPGGGSELHVIGAA